MFAFDFSDFFVFVLQLERLGTGRRRHLCLCCKSGHAPCPTMLLSRPGALNGPKRLALVRHHLTAGEFHGLVRPKHPSSVAAFSLSYLPSASVAIELDPAKPSFCDVASYSFLPAPPY